MSTISSISQLIVGEFKQQLSSETGKYAKIVAVALAILSAVAVAYFITKNYMAKEIESHSSSKIPQVINNDTREKPTPLVNTDHVAYAPALANPLETIDRSSAASIALLFPSTPEEISTKIEQSKTEAAQGIDQIIAIPAHQRSFENTIKALDNLKVHTLHARYRIDCMGRLHPDEATRDAAQSAVKELSAYTIETFEANPQVYATFREYQDGNGKVEKLSSVQQYFLKELEKVYQKAGFKLSDEDFQQVKELKQEIAALETDFLTNTANDKGEVRVKKDALTGIPETVIAQLATEGEDYILTCDRNIKTPVLAECSVEATREALFQADVNRAKEKNLPILKLVIAKRDQLARLLGFDSYAHYDLDDAMAEHPQRALNFIQEVTNAAQGRTKREIEIATEHLPDLVDVSDAGKVKPWDINYLLEQYKKKFLQVDETKISEYFPMDKTIEGLFAVYSKFFSVEFNRCQVEGLWHPDAEIIELSKQGTVLGYIVIDLHPREGKIPAAQQYPAVPSQKAGQGGDDQAAVTVVMANFSKATEDKPSLLRLDEVSTFFHEFGHAIHSVLGRTEMAGHAGTTVKRDFVEMPSQILEEWLWKPEILNMISGHYQTSEPLPAQLIESKVKARQFGFGYFALRQMFLARMSLEFFLEGADKDTHTINEKNREEVLTPLVSNPDSNIEAVFPHPMSYGAKYYGYMWSQVFASVVFMSICKSDGLLDPDIGKKYVDKIIGRGGSADPKELLADFLGQKFSDEAVAEWLSDFYKHMGLVEG